MSPATVSVRLARVGDIAAIRAIEATPEYRDCIGMWPESEYRQAIASNSSSVVVAENVDGVAGFYVLRGIGEKDRSLEVMRVAVRTPAAGTGSTLLKHSIHEAFERYLAHRLWLDVFTTNVRAQSLYARLGFVHEGTLRDSKFRHGKFQSQHLMAMLEDEYRGQYTATTDTTAAMPAATGEQQ